MARPLVDAHDGFAGRPGRQAEHLARLRVQPGVLEMDALVPFDVEVPLVGLRELFVPSDFPVYLHFHVPGPSVPDDVAATIDRWGGFTVLSVFASIWLCDSAAYFVGRAIGKHKLFERVSPNKTWEGAIAGLVFAIGGFVLAHHLLLPYLSLRDALVCGGIVGVFGQLGDLGESLLKRDAGVKDSSNLIPGHGGVLDRFDSLLFVSPLIYCYLDFVVF